MGEGAEKGIAVAGQLMVSARHLEKSYRLPPAPFEKGARVIRALADVSIEIERGKTYGLVGESGSGKSTLGRCLAALETIDSGEIEFEGKSFQAYSKEELRRARRRFQTIFQDPYSSLNPRKTIGRAIGEPLDIHNVGGKPHRQARVRDLMGLVGLRSDQIGRYPHELSGGQRQRVVIARALALEPSFIILDEPTSALDVSVQAQVVNLLLDLQERFSLTYLFISHDLMLVRHMSDQVAVMKSGAIVEQGSSASVFDNPQQPYTIKLIEQSPKL